MTLGEASRVKGHADDGFPAVRASFAELAAEQSAGNAVAIVHDGRLAVSLWSGIADSRTGVAWEEDSIATVFSVSKAVLSILTLRLAESGHIKLQAPISVYWPEFSSAGKAGITIEQVLSHRAGLVSLDVDLTIDDVIQWDPVIRALEAQRPQWTPGTHYGYHALTFGWLVGETLRRATGREVSDLVREHFAEPLGVDLWLGLPEREFTRLAYLESAGAPVAEPDPAVAAYLERTFGRSAIQRSLTLGGAFPLELFSSDAGFNDPRVVAAGVPAAGMVASAPALARLFAATISQLPEMRLLGDDSIRNALALRSEGDDWGGVSSPSVRFSTGFMLDGDPVRRLLSPASFGHDGALGELVFADASHGVGFAYLTNRSGGISDDRAARLVASLRADLASQSLGAGTVVGPWGAR